MRIYRSESYTQDANGTAKEPLLTIEQTNMIAPPQTVYVTLADAPLLIAELQEFVKQHTATPSTLLKLSKVTREIPVGERKDVTEKMSVAGEVIRMEKHFREAIESKEIEATNEEAYDFLNGWMESYHLLNWSTSDTWFTQKEWEAIRDLGRERLYTIVAELRVGGDA